MDNRRTTMLMAGLTRLIICVLGGVLWINYQYATRHLGGDSFYIQWLASRELVTQGNSPYSESNQSNINDQLNKISYIKEPKTYQYLAPVYSSFIFLPFGLISNVTLAYAIWITTLEMQLIINIFIGFRLTGWRPGLVIFTLL